MIARKVRPAHFLQGFVLALGLTLPSWAQNAGLDAEAVRKAILEIPIWHVDRTNGTTSWHFEMRGADLWAKAINNDGRIMPDVKVEVTNDGLTWIDPGGQRIVLHYDPQDLQFPFKGADEQGRIYQFTPK